MTRRDEILQAAAELFAARGFHGVSIVELGAACGISGPALYKHFSGKEAILAEMLVQISEELLDEGRRRVRRASGGEDTMRALLDWHVSFAVTHRELIVVQDRDWSSLPDDAREQVRELQRKYVEIWVRALRRLRLDLRAPEARARVHATFGLLNSTPYSAFLEDVEMHGLLMTMGRAALLA